MDGSKKALGMSDSVKLTVVFLSDFRSFMQRVHYRCNQSMIFFYVLLNNTQIGIKLIDKVLSCKRC